MSDIDRAVLEEIATANRILFHQGVVDAFGHVSLRHPSRPDHFLLARNMAPGLVTADDIITFGPDSEPVNAAGRGVYLERFLHGEIFDARPDVMAVVHSHSASVVPFGIVRGVAFRAVCHMCGFLGTHTPVFEIRECAGESSDLLIRDRTLGKALAESLGERPAVLMRGHGATVVAASLREVVFRAVYTEVNARLQSEALRLGQVTYLTEGEGAATTVTNRGQINRAWDLWARQAAGLSA
jgi:HCOMODA/2-hydroxy-3-carboxy-muconic semialdehyde decarboxylase